MRSATGRRTLSAPARIKASPPSTSSTSPSCPSETIRTRTPGRTSPPASCWAEVSARAWLARAAWSTVACHSSSWRRASAAWRSDGAACSEARSAATWPRAASISAASSAPIRAAASRCARRPASSAARARSSAAAALAAASSAVRRCRWSAARSASRAAQRLAQRPALAGPGGAGPLDHGGRKADPGGDLDGRGAARGAQVDLVGGEEPLGVEADPGVRVALVHQGQRLELVEVGGDEHGGALLHQALQDGGGQGRTFSRVGVGGDLVHQHQRAGDGAGEHVLHRGEVRGEGGEVLGQVAALVHGGVHLQVERQPRSQGGRDGQACPQEEGRHAHRGDGHRLPAAVGAGDDERAARRLQAHVAGDHLLALQHQDGVAQGEELEAARGRRHLGRVGVEVGGEHAPRPRRGRAARAPGGPGPAPRSPRRAPRTARAGCAAPPRRRRRWRWRARCRAPPSSRARRTASAPTARRCARCPGPGPDRWPAPAARSDRCGW